MLREIRNIYSDNRFLINTMIGVIGIGFLVLVMKLRAYTISHSMSLKSDALESLVNILTGMFALFAFVYGKKLPDRNHPYGHGKIEFFSSFFEGVLIILAGILIIYESIEKLFLGFEYQRIEEGLFLNFAGGSINGIMGVILLFLGKKHNSDAIRAEGLHLLTDFITTIGIAAGLLTVIFTGLKIVDPVISLVLGVWLFFSGMKLVFVSMKKLMDGDNPAILTIILDIINRNRDDRIISIHGARVMQSGDYFHIDLHFVVPEYLTVDEANELIHNYEERVIKEAGIRGEFHSHIDPCKKSYCKYCYVPDCFLRRENCTESNHISYEQAISWPGEDKKRLLLHY